MCVIKPFIDSWVVLNDVDLILSVPPTKINRRYQPVEEISKKIAEYLGIFYDSSVFKKITDIEAKNITDDTFKAGKTIIKNKMARKRHNILLVDDLYGTGKTMTECVKLLKEDPNIGQVYVLTLTKKRT